MAASEVTETRVRLLDAAERLFGENGMDGVSLRDITSVAGANVAAVNYHFGSRDGLIREVFGRRMLPLNEERLRLMDLAESAAGNAPPTLESILDAFIGPTFRFFKDHPDFMRMMARLHMESSDQAFETLMHTGRFLELVDRIRGLLIRAMPHSEKNELWWSMHFLLGAMIHTWTGCEKMEKVSRGECSYDGDEEMIRRLVRFAAAGMRAAPRGEEEVAG